MDLYCISIFLSVDKIQSFIEMCTKKKIETKGISITDQTGESGNGWQVNIDGLKLLLLPCNNFHTDTDFEIGITAGSKSEWNVFLRKAEIILKNDYSRFQKDETEYFLAEDSHIHGNIFFIFDGSKFEGKSLVKFSCKMNEWDFLFYKEKITKLLEKNILDKIEVSRGGSFKVEKIIVRQKDEDIVFNF